MGNKVILFNGAPNSGKDTSAEIMQKLYGFGKIAAFKDELYKETAKHFGLDVDTFRKIARDRVLKELKDRRLVSTEGMNILQRAKQFIKGLFTNVGLTPREALIHVSEKLIKPNFGDSYFGKKLKDHLDQIAVTSEDIFFVPDSGFMSELKPLVEAGYDIYLVRIHRDGCTFENDSRTELTDEMLKELGIKGYDIYNNGTLHDLELELLDLATCKFHKGGNKV